MANCIRFLNPYSWQSSTFAFWRYPSLQKGFFQSWQNYQPLLSKSQIINSRHHACLPFEELISAGLKLRKSSDHKTMTLYRRQLNYNLSSIAKTSSSAIAERPCCSVRLFWPKVEDWNWETILYRQYRSIFNHCDIIGLQSYRIRWITQLRRSRSFKIIVIGTNRKPVCNFLLVINDNWHPILYRFGVIAAYCSNFGYFAFSSPFGGLGTIYNVHLGLIGKCIVDFLLVLIELISLSVMAEALRAKLDRKSAISLKCGHFDPIFLVEGVASTNYFCTDTSHS